MPRVIALWLLIAIGVLRAQEPKAPSKPDAKADLAILAAAHKADLDDVAADYEKWLTTLQKWYLAGLDKLQAESMKTGDLDGALAFKAERERIVTRAETTKEQIQAMPPTLARLRAAYEPALKKLVDQAAQRKETARGKHLERLEALQKRLTISGAFDDALLVKAEKDRFSSEIPSLSSDKTQPFVNSLGMKFVPVAITGGPTDGTRILFSVWDTRVQDYGEYAQAKGIAPQKAKSELGPTHPVVLVSWEDATSFCEWLTARERASGKIGAHDEYRLPSDHEWSCAAGIGQLEKAESDPHSKSGKIEKVYPWGTDWPPPKDAGNYSPKLQMDEVKFISPVGTFAANENGLFDMGGNVWQWCKDWESAKKAGRVLRGGSWKDDSEGRLRSSYRLVIAPARAVDYAGFRCVLALEK